MYRKKISLLYKHNLQRVLDTYDPYMEKLTENSKRRLESNKNYREFLKLIKEKKYDDFSVELFGETDLQMLEASNIIKDLIFLIEKREENAY